MKKLFKYFLTLFVSALLSEKSSAQQNSSPVISMEVECLAVTNFINSDSIVDYNDSTQYSAQMIIAIDDTSVVSSIEVKFGKTNQDILMTRSFDFGIPGSFGNGVSFSRNGYNIIIGLGEIFLGVGKFYAEMKIRRTDDSYSQIFSFSK